MENGQTQIVDPAKVELNRSANILDLTTYDKRQLDPFIRTPVSLPNLLNPRQQTRSYAFSGISIDEIYFEPSYVSLEFETALRLLSEAAINIDEAINAIRANLPIVADTAVMHIQ